MIKDEHQRENKKNKSIYLLSIRETQKPSRNTELDSNWAGTQSIFRSDTFVPNRKQTDYQP